MSGAMGGDDAPLTQALDSFDQLSLRRDRERRRVTEEENAVRCLEELLAEKQRETQQLAREAESRAAELAALERRVPALEDTHHGARRSLQMLTQMRDLLNKQLDFEKRKTEEMLQKLDDEVKEAAARWERYEAVYLTMPAYQRKLELDSLAAEERELNERREQLETALNSRVSDRDFCVRLAECWRQARLLEGAIAGGDQSPERENMSGACSQGFGTPRCSRTPSPVYDMETGNESGGAEETAERSDVSEDDRTADAASILAERGDRYQTEGEPSEAAASFCDAGSGQGTPQKGSSPLQEPVSPPQGAMRSPTPTQSVMPSPPRGVASPQRQTTERQTQALPQAGPRPTEPVQRPPPPAVTSPAPHTRPSPEKPQWSTEPVPPVRRQSSFLIQLPSLYRPSRPRADRPTDTSTGGRTASTASPARSLTNTSAVHRPPQAPSPLRAPQRQPSPQTAAPEDVEMTDVQEARPAPVRQPPAGLSRPDLAGSSRGGNSERAASRDSSPSESPSPRKTVAMEQRQQQQPNITAEEQREQSHIAGQQQAPRFAMGQHQFQQPPRIAMGQQQPQQPSRIEMRQQRPQQPPHTTAEQQQQLQKPLNTTAEQQQQLQQPPNTREAQQPPPAVEKEVPPAPTPPGSQNMLGGRQYWLPMPPDTPTAPPVDERRSFVQRLRQSPELARRPPPAARKPAAPLEPGLEHQFLRPALPSPHRAAPGPAPAASPQSIFDTPRRPAVEPASPQRPPVGSPSRAVPQSTAPSTPRAAAPAAEPATPVRPAAAAAGDAPRSMASFFTSPETDVGEMDSSFSLFGGPPGGKVASPQPPPPSGMSLFGAGDVGGDGDQGADDFSFSFFGGGSSDAEKETSSGGGGVFNFF